jgi:hypothetical protein
MAALSATLETPPGADPNFPGGWNYQSASNRQTFDLVRNRYYVPIVGIGGGVGGVQIIDLSSMTTSRTVTLAQMYAGTPYGLPAGVPPSQSIYDIKCGRGTDLYMLTAGDPSAGSQYTRFTRVDPNTMKVTGEFYQSKTFPPPITCVNPGGWQFGIVNTTASRTIVLYPINGAEHLGPEIFDGTSMLPIGVGPTPRDYAYNLMFCAGAKHADGSCDFYMLDPSTNSSAAGLIDIWRINVSNAPAMTSTKTGTLNVLSLFTPTANLFVGQAEYDPAHDTLILTVTPSTTPNATPSWIISVSSNGTINWSHYAPNWGGSVYNDAQYNLTSADTYMFGTSNSLTMLDTGTGAVIYTGSILIEGSQNAGSFFHVWDAAQNAYWTYLFAAGVVRIDFVPTPSAAKPKLGLLRHPELYFLGLPR